MKIDVEANEIRDGQIEKISLVTNGAIRAPFKILKTEEISAHTGTDTMKDKLTKIFGSTDEKSKVVALYIRKSVAKQWLPIVKEQGFVANKENAQLEGDIIILKQEGFDPEAEGSVIALNKDVAVQLDTVVKFFDPFPASSSFDENVTAAAFFPGLSNAMESLAETVWNVLNGSDSTEDATSEVAKQVKAFGNHVNNLVAELPTTVFKMESQSLTPEFGSYTVSNTTDNTMTITSDEESDMSKPVIKEVAAGDLDGLLDDAPAADAAIAAVDATIAKEVDAGKTGSVAKGDEGSPKSGGSPGNPVVMNTSDTGLVDLDEGGVPAGFRKEERVLKQIEDGKIVEKFAHFFVNDDTKEEIFAGFFEKTADSGDLEPAPAVSAERAYTPAENKLFEAMGVMVKSVTDLKETVEKQNERIANVEKTADSAVETAESTVVMTIAEDLDESLATLQGHTKVQKAALNGEAIVKTDEEVFAGLLPELSGSAA